MPDELNATAHCTLCADNRRKIGVKPAFSVPPPRLDVSGVQICPTHDLGGPAEAYPAKIAEVIGHA